jgi:hypothetical protein
MPHDPLHPSRRQLLGASAGLVGAAALAGPPKDAPAASERPTAPPLATSGDRAGPDWKERLTVTVGPNKADLAGTTDRVIQAAVDLVHRYGGGTVRLLPGTYRLRNAVHLQSGLRLVGAGSDTVLIKEPSVTTKLLEDSDWYDQEITLADARGFQLGDGVCLRARNPHGGQTVLKRTLVARSGNRFQLDRPLRENLWLVGTATAATLFPILSGDNVSDIHIEGLCLDGNRAGNDNLDGNYAACIFLQDCNRTHIHKVTARSYNGDGISWQVCHDVVVEDCHSHDHAGLGLHPGSGSQRPTIRNNRLEGNDIGLFFCWGVRAGLAEKNRITSSRSVGLSIGHRDTDNLIRDNDIRTSGKVGVLFRPERGKAFAPHRNRLEDNRITDSGGDAGVGIDVQGEVDGLVLCRNVLRETRGPAKRTAIRLGPRVGPVELKDNRSDGFATALADQRRKSR